MRKKYSRIPNDNSTAFVKTAQKITVNGCSVTLNFLPDSGGNVIDTVKKMLISSQYQDVPHTTDQSG